MRPIDAVYTFDAMVHVDLHSLVLYVATAAAVVATGGLLAMSIADTTNDLGFYTNSTIATAGTFSSLRL